VPRFSLDFVYFIGVFAYTVRTKIDSVPGFPQVFQQESLGLAHRSGLAPAPDGL
jgi:hypothetical protein